MIKIVKGKKIPPRDFGRPNGPKKIYPFAEMKKGDAFSVGFEKKNAVYACLHVHNKTHSKRVKLVSRNIGDKAWFWKA